MSSNEMAKKISAKDKKKQYEELRAKVIKLLDEKEKLIDANTLRMYDRKTDGISPKQYKTPKLTELYNTLKHLKAPEPREPNHVLMTSANFHHYNQIAHIKNSGDEEAEKKVKRINRVIRKQENEKYKVWRVVILRKYKYSKEGHKDPKKERGEERTQGMEDFTVKGSEMKARQKANDLLSSKYAHYELVDNYYTQHMILVLDYYYEISAIDIREYKQIKLPMKSAFVLRNDWLKHAEGIAKNSYDDMKGQCVYETLTEHLKPRWPTVSKEKLFDIFSEFVNKENINSYLDNDIFDDEFTMESGVNTEMIRYLCNKKKISLYAFDNKENCFDKLHFASSNHRPIVYYMCNGHMYLISDSKAVVSIGNVRENKTIIQSSLLEIEKKTKESEKIDYIECDTFEEALQHENKTVYLQKVHITDEVHQYINDTKIVPQIKSENYKFTQITLKHKNLKIVCDPSYMGLEENEDRGCDWKCIKLVCENAGIQFNNQTIGKLIQEVQKKFFKVAERYTPTEEEKQNIIIEQNSVCNECKASTEKYEFDHIKPLINGGSNELSNIQALCRGCHFLKTNQERENGDFIKMDEIASTFNLDTLKLIKSNSIAHLAFVERLQHENNYKNKNNLNKLDHVKCRRNLVMHNKFDFPKFSVMDKPAFYKGGNIECGYYEVHTDNYYPFRGNGWYNYVLVQYGLENNIIKKEDIKYQFLPSYKIPADYFKEFCEYLIKISKETKQDKHIINSLIGCWGIQRSEFEQIHITTSKYEASREMMNPNVMVMSQKLNDETTLYSVVERKVINKDDLYLPLYHQILALEALNLHKLEQLIIKNHGTPRERNTDAILYTGPKINIDDYFYDDNKQVLKYRYDDLSLLRIEGRSVYTRTNKYKPMKYKYDEYEENDDFDKLAEEVYKSNESLLLLGMAGTGKTTLVNKIIDLIEKDGKKCERLAPTKKAASHIKGQTNHSFYLNLALSNNYEKKLLKRLNYVDYIIVDEISMVKEIFYRLYIQIKRYVPKMKFIICGDFGQLMPVNDSYTGDYSKSPALHNLCDGNKLNLKVCRRSDKELFELYLKYYDNIKNKNFTDDIDLSKFKMNQLNKRNLAFSHRTRIAVNNKCIEKFSKGKDYILAERSYSNYKTQDTKIYIGLPIVCYKNNKEFNICNGDIFYVKHINHEQNTFTFGCEIGDEEYTQEVNKFKTLFYPAYCITIHVSQGCTYDEPFTIWDWKHEMMNNRAKYVALSRATKLELISIVE